MDVGRQLLQADEKTFEAAEEAPFNKPEHPPSPPAPSDEKFEEVPDPEESKGLCPP